MRDAARRRPTPPWRPWRRATSPSRSRSLRIFRTTTGLVWRLFAIASEVVPSSPAQATKLMMWTALAIRLFAVITVTISVKLEHRVRFATIPASTGGVPGDAGVVDQVGSVAVAAG